MYPGIDLCGEADEVLDEERARSHSAGRHGTGFHHRLNPSQQHGAQPERRRPGQRRSCARDARCHIARQGQIAAHRLRPIPAGPQLDAGSPWIADQEEGNYEQAIVPPSPTGRYPYILANMIRRSYTSYASVSRSIGFRIEPISSTVYNVYPTSFTIGHGMGLESAVYGYVTAILVFADAPN